MRESRGYLELILGLAGRGGRAVLRRGSAAANLLRSGARMTPGAWMFLRGADTVLIWRLCAAYTHLTWG